MGEQMRLSMLPPLSDNEDLKDLEKVLSDMCRIILMGEDDVKAPNCVTDMDVLRDLAPLFN